MRIMIVISLLSLYGCANFAASVGGTFIGNIASDRVLKNIDRKPAEVVDRSKK
jgi:hypothetical protein